MRNKYILIIVFLILSLLASLFLVFRSTSFFGKTQTINQSSIVLENSYLFTSPLQAKSDGKEQIRVMVYLLDGRGVGVPNQKVKLNISNYIKVSDIQPITDELGKAIFDISCIKSDQYEISAQVDNKTISQKVRVVFY